MAQSRVELALILYFAKIYLVLVTLMELGLFIYKVSLCQIILKRLPMGISLYIYLTQKKG